MVLGYLLQAVKYTFHKNKKYVSHYITNQNRTEAGTEPEKSLGGTELNCCSIKAHSTLYCIHFRLGEAVGGSMVSEAVGGGSSPLPHRWIRP